MGTHKTDTTRMRIVMVHLGMITVPNLIDLGTVWINQLNHKQDLYPTPELLNSPREK